MRLETPHGRVCGVQHWTEVREDIRHVLVELLLNGLVNPFALGLVAHDAALLDKAIDLGVRVFAAVPTALGMEHRKDIPSGSARPPHPMATASLSDPCAMLKSAVASRTWICMSMPTSRACACTSCAV